jgi:hypothetical protein
LLLHQKEKIEDRGGGGEKSGRWAGEQDEKRRALPLGAVGGRAKEKGESFADLGFADFRDCSASRSDRCYA